MDQQIYILDLKPQNSFIKYAVDAGYTVFVVSWVNPDGSYRDVGIDTYVEEVSSRPLKRQDHHRAKAGHTIGYCIAGTLLTIALAHMAKTGDDSIKSATYFTTLTDFEMRENFPSLIDDAFLKGIEGEVEEKGFLRGVLYGAHLLLSSRA